MLRGSCHCGAAGWQFQGQPEKATLCNCTVCQRWGALWAHGFIGENFHISGTTNRYLRSPKTIEFRFCKICSCVVFWCAASKGEDGRHYGAVNLRLADPTQISALAVEFFDGLQTMRALDRDGTCVADILRQ